MRLLPLQSNSHANLLCAVLCGCGCLLIPAPSHAQRWFGNLSLSAQRSHVAISGGETTGLYTANGYLNVEDILFYKTRIRLATSLDWRREAFSSRRQYRPTYYLYLIGSGYELNSSYSPYHRLTTRVSDTSIGAAFRLYLRDWRTSMMVNVPKYPLVSLVVNQNRQYDEETTRSYDSRQRTIVAESNFQRTLYSLRANVNHTRRDNYISGLTNDITRSVNGAVSFFTPPSSVGNLSTSYNYYHSRRTVGENEGEASATHSLAMIATSSLINTVHASLSYSGRTTESDSRIADILADRSQTSSGLLAYTPFTFAEFQLGKTYRIEHVAGLNDITEYLTLAGIFSRQLRQGVDSRLALTRTTFQQSNRVIEHRNQFGDVDSSQNIDHYFIDSWYGSLNFSAFPYIKTNASYSISRDSKPTTQSRKYQTTGTIDSRFVFSEQLEGRLGYTSSYQGSKLRFGQAFSAIWNLGASWIPQRSLTTSLTYTYATYQTTIRQRSGNLNAYLSYAFRRAYSWFISYGIQEQTQQIQPGLGDPATVTTVRPELWNAQLLIYTGSRSTLTFSYVRTSGNRLQGRIADIETVQGTFNLQI